MKGKAVLKALLFAYAVTVFFFVPCVFIIPI